MNRSRAVVDLSQHPQPPCGRRENRLLTAVAGCLMMILCGLPGGGQLLAQEADRVISPVEAKEFTLEQLMESRIYSVSKKAEKLSTAASAITVITEEDV